jgi:hypothetical protein
VDFRPDSVQIKPAFGRQLTPFHDGGFIFIQTPSAGSQIEAVVTAMNVFSTSAMAVAAVDRLVDHSTIIQIHGESYRRKRARRSAP